MKAITSMATRAVLAELAVKARKAGLPSFEIESVGGIDAAARVSTGEAFDLVFLAMDTMSRLAASGHVDARSVTPLLVSPVALAVPSRTGVAERPAGVAFPNASALRSGLREAAHIGHSTGPSGSAFLRMIEEWGMAAELADRLVQAPPGVPVAKLLAERKVDLGLQQLSELVGAPGIRILGVLPEDCRTDTVFAGAVARTAVDAEQPRAILEFLGSSAVSEIKIAHNFGDPST